MTSICFRMLCVVRCSCIFEMFCYIASILLKPRQVQKGSIFLNKMKNLINKVTLEINFYNTFIDIVNVKIFTRNISETILNDEGNCRFSPPDFIFRRITTIWKPPNVPSCGPKQTFFFVEVFQDEVSLLICCSVADDKKTPGHGEILLWLNHIVVRPSCFVSSLFLRISASEICKRHYGNFLEDAFLTLSTIYTYFCHKGTHSLLCW